MRTTVRVVGVLAVTVAHAIGWPTASSAEAPNTQGWWSTFAVPAPGVRAPGAADVPSDGLLVEGGTGQAPFAFAALRYEVSDPAALGTLMLRVVPGSGTTPGAKIRVCPLVLPFFTPADGGPMADAPNYDCRQAVTSGASQDGSTYRFDVRKLVAEGVLAIALLPSSSTDRVVIARPDESSLPVGASTTYDPSQSAARESSSSGGAIVAANPSPAPVQSYAQGGPTNSPLALDVPITAADVPAAPLTMESPQPSIGSRALGQVSSAQRPVTGHAALRTLLLILFGITLAAALWLSAGLDSVGHEGDQLNSDNGRLVVPH